MSGIDKYCPGHFSITAIAQPFKSDWDVVENQSLSNQWVDQVRQLRIKISGSTVGYFLHYSKFLSDFYAVKNQVHIYNVIAVSSVALLQLIVATKWLQSSFAICHLLSVTCFLYETCYYLHKLVSFSSFLYVS